MRNHASDVNRPSSAGRGSHAFQPLAAYEELRPRVAALLLGSLALAVLPYAGSLPLPWHHRFVATGGYQVVRGIDGASWLVAAAVVVAGFLIRFIRVPPGFISRWLFAFATVLIALGMYSDYINWHSRAAQLQATAYYGPGFYLALIGSLALILANVLCWRIE